MSNTVFSTILYLFCEKHLTLSRFNVNMIKNKFLVLSYDRGAIFTSMLYFAAAPTGGKGKLPKLYEQPSHIAGVLQNMQYTVTLVKRYQTEKSLLYLYLDFITLHQ